MFFYFLMWKSLNWDWCKFW